MQRISNYTFYTFNILLLYYNKKNVVRFKFVTLIFMGYPRVYAKIMTNIWMWNTVFFFFLFLKIEVMQRTTIKCWPIKRFLTTMRILAWLAINLKGVRKSSSVHFAVASMRVVCHSISLKRRISPLPGSLIRVDLRSLGVCHVGDIDWTLTLESC